MTWEKKKTLNCNCSVCVNWLRKICRNLGQSSGVRAEMEPHTPRIRTSEYTHFSTTFSCSTWGHWWLWRFKRKRIISGWNSNFRTSYLSGWHSFFISWRMRVHISTQKFVTLTEIFHDCLQSLHIDVGVLLQIRTRPVLGRHFYLITR
jgi:hypothetical protein